MFGTKRKSRTERIAEDAWGHLVSAVESAGEAARVVGRRTSDRVQDLAQDVADEASSRAGTASSRVNSAADEARARASAALDALAGRKPRRPWGWIAMALLGGAALGWAAAASGTKAVATMAERFGETRRRDETSGDRRGTGRSEAGPTPTGTTTSYETPAARSSDTMPSGPPAV